MIQALAHMPHQLSFIIRPINTKITAKLNHSSAKYFMVGISAFAIDYVVLLFLYYVLNIKLEIATSVGFITGFIISFTANKQWVFASGYQKKRTGRQITEYLLLLVFNFFFTVGGVRLLNEQGIRPVFGKLCIMAVIMCWNYALFRWVIFASEPAHRSSLS